MPAAPEFWQRRGPAAAFLFPLARLYRRITWLRRLAYERGWFKVERIDVPVVVVGNIAVGGSGKTPVVLWLVEHLKQAGRNPGVVSRGYGGRVRRPTGVTRQSKPAKVGDEPVLIAARTGVPVWVGPDRVAVARALRKAHPEVDVIVSDDGMQHYRLGRDCEIAVVDEAQLANRLPLPSGPMREPLHRLAECQLVLAHGELTPHVHAACPPAPVFKMRLMPTAFYDLADPRRRRAPAEFADKRLVALAGIGRPQRFFDTLEGLGLQLAERRAFPDHHAFRRADLAFAKGSTLLVTEKDAVKLRAFAPADTWVLPVEADIREGAFERVMERL